MIHKMRPVSTKRQANLLGKINIFYITKVIMTTQSKIANSGLTSHYRLAESSPTLK